MNTVNTNKHITQLYLGNAKQHIGNNKITEEGIDVIIKALKKNETLKSLNICITY